MHTFPQVFLEKCNVGFGRSEGVDIVFSKGERDKLLRIVELSFGEGKAIHLRPQTCALGKELLCTFSVAPKVVCTEEEVEFGEASRLPGKVKDRRGAWSSVDVDRTVVLGWESS